MRFLCLHGRGTNSDIFEAQLSPLVSRLGAEHSFDFVDAPFECSAAPGISSLYPGPYLAWLSRYEPEYVAEAHTFLRSVIEEDGPYDGIIGFSQGASLAASLLLCYEHQRAEVTDRSEVETPFKVAIFFNSVMLFSPSAEIGSDITAQIRQQEEKYMGFLTGDTQTQGISTASSSRSETRSSSPVPETATAVADTAGSSEIKWRMPQWSSSTTSLTSFSSDSSSSEEPSREVKIARKMSVATESIRLLKTPTVFGFPPVTFNHRISIPTMHVIGQDDDFAEHSRTLVDLCLEEKAEVLVVDGGHDLPRSKLALQRCAQLFDMVTMMGSLNTF